jgi:hypothetical protein
MIGKCSFALFYHRVPVVLMRWELFLAYTNILGVKQHRNSFFVGKEGSGWRLNL